MKSTKTIQEILENGEVSKELLKLFDPTKKIPLYISPYKLILFAETVKEVKENIEKSNNPRLIVLETWLILDYCVRDLILSGLQLKRFKTEKFDVLPMSFSGCLRLLKNLRNDQLKRNPNPSVNFISLPPNFLSFLLDNYKNELDILIKIETEYYKKYYPAALSLELFDQFDNPEYRNVDEGWISVVERLSKKWFNEAEQLNSVRNLASHEIESDEIFKKFNINDKDEKEKINHLKTKCKELLNQLIGIAI